MEIEAKAILTSEKQLSEIERVLKMNYAIGEGLKLISTDRYYKTTVGKIIRIRNVDYPGKGNSRNYITFKEKSIIHGIEVNKEYEQEVSTDFLTYVMFPLLVESKAYGPFCKSKDYIQYRYLEPTEKRFYKIDCGYAWSGVGGKVSYVEIETIVNDLDDAQLYNQIGIIREMFRTLGIDALITEKPWAEVLGDTGWTTQLF